MPMARSAIQSSPFSTLTGSALEFADEGEHEGRVRRVIDLVGGADLLDAALAHHHDAVGKLQRLFLVVGDEDGGVAGPVVDFAQPAAQLLADLGVERAERLVEQQHARLDGERAGQRHALPLAAGELRRIALFQTRELHEVEQLRARRRGSRRCGGRPSRGRTFRPKAMLSATVMCRNSA